MNILMVTNTYKPITGGLEKSVENFTQEFRRRGHEVLIVAPQFEEEIEAEPGVVRVPAIKHFNKTDFSLPLPIPGVVEKALKHFQPHLVHSHHPFLLGDTAKIISQVNEIPLIFTHHSLYEKNVHYVPIDKKLMKEFVVKLSIGYANFCDLVIAPSQSLAAILKERGLKSNLEIIPTGIDYENFCKGNASKFREKNQIPKDVFLLGFISRLAEEKNVRFLCKAVDSFLKKNKNAHFLVGGKGPEEKEMRKILDSVKNRVHFVGFLEGQDLIDAYHSLDLLAFASHSETQGLVLVEAMSAGTAVVAVKAPGVKDVVKEGLNGKLIERDNIKEFSQALNDFADKDSSEKKEFSENCRKFAKEFSMKICAEKMLKKYQSVIEEGCKNCSPDKDWQNVSRWAKAQTELLRNIALATKKATERLAKEKK